MPQFDIVSLKEALEATRNDRWLSEKFGEEYDVPQCPECEGTNLNEDGTACWNCNASDYLDRN